MTAHDIQIVNGVYWCETENVIADECSDEDRCAYDCCCNRKPDDGLTALLAGKTISEVLSGHLPSDHGAEPATVLVFTDGTDHTFHHPRDED